MVATDFEKTFSSQDLEPVMYISEEPSGGVRLERSVRHVITRCRLEYEVNAWMSFEKA